MSQKRALFVLLGLIILFLVAQAGQANAQEFALGKDNAATNVCPGSTLLLQTTVHSSTGGSFTISQAGDASKFSISVPSGFILAPGESKTIYTYVTPPSSAQQGTYSLRVTVTSSGKSQNVDYAIIVEDCRSSSLQIDQVKQICPGDTGTYKAILSNTGRFTESYAIDIEGQAREWATLSDSAVALEAGQQKELFVYLTPPLGETGTFDFTLTATSSSGAFESAMAQINVLPCYDYELGADKALYELCEAEQLVVPLTLENKGTVANTFHLTLDAPNFVALEKDIITLPAEQIVIVNLIISPAFGIQGDFPTRVVIRSDLGEISKGLLLTTRVNKCHGIQVEIAADSAAVCNAFSTQQEVLVKNIGKFENTFALSVQGAEFASLNKETVTLASEAQEAVILTLIPPEGTPAKTFTVTVTAIDPTSKASASDTLQLATITREKCFLPSIEAAQKHVEVAKDSAAAVSFSIENKGLEDASYELELSGNALPFIQINPSSLTLEAAESETVFLHIAPSTATAEGNYETIVTARVKDSQISASETLSIKVLPQGEVTIITPTGGVIGAEDGRTPLQAIIDFFNRLFSFITAPAANETNVTIEEPEEQEEEEPEPEEEPEEEEEGEEEEPEEEKEPEENIWEKIKKFFANLFTVPTAEINLTNFSDEQQEQEQPEEQEEEEEEPEEQEEEIEQEEQEEEPSETTEAAGFSMQGVKNFMSEYAYHLVAAVILILIIIVVATGYWKRIVDFFFEEEETPAAGEKVNKTKVVKAKK